VTIAFNTWFQGQNAEEQRKKTSNNGSGP